MFLILAHLAECRLATSRDVTQQLSFISPKYASLALTRCYRRGFVSRQPYKRGREHGYIYKLTNKGAEWVLYKHSQMTKEDQRDKKPQKHVGNKGIPVQNVMILKPDGNRQKDNAFTFLKIGLKLAFLNLCYNLYQSQKQQHNALRERDFYGILALIRWSRNDDAIRYLWWEHLKKSSGRNQKEKTAASLESLRRPWSTASETRPRFESRPVEFFQRGQLQGLKYGLELGMAIGETRQLMQDQNALLTILKKEFRSPSLNNAYVTTLQTVSTETSKIQKPTEATSKSAFTPQNITVEESRENEDDWAEMNYWWQNLPKQD